MAYVIYTSGSTGLPKGALLTHGGACAIVDGLVGELGVGAESRVLQNVPLGFDVSISEIFMALFSGATLCLADPEKLMPTSEFIDLLEERGITTLSITASALAQLPHAALPKLPTLVVGGEPYRRRHASLAAGQARVERVRADRGDDHRDARAGRRRLGTACRTSARHCRESKRTCWTKSDNRCRSACPASSGSAESASPWVISRDRS